MNSTKFIEECKKYDLGTEIYLTDDSGNEYDIEEIGAVMFGQPHLCIKLKIMAHQKTFYMVFLIIFLSGLWMGMEKFGIF